MFGKPRVVKEKEAPPPPDGVAEIALCVFDKKHRVKYAFRSRDHSVVSGDAFNVLRDPQKAFDNSVLAEAVASNTSALLTFTFGDGVAKYLSVLPYEHKPGKIYYACLQISVQKADDETGMPAYIRALREGRACLLIADAGKTIVSVSANIPEAFGYSRTALEGLQLSDLFGPADLNMISSCSPNTNESILSCSFSCQDQSRRDVEVKKYSTTDGYVLYTICDVTRAQLNEEIAAVTTRERRRIGQDLHDSIGQLLTGISLLSRSLANSLLREKALESDDAVQISELADDANNQIRQISRGLMPSDIVYRGLYPSLRDLAKMTSDSCGFQCAAIIDESIEFSDGAVETHLFRIAQEAVHNAVRHSGGSEIEIIISERNGLPQLEIKDNGSWRNIMENSGGIGMKTMQYRASAINGRLNIGQIAGGGTHVVCRLEAEEVQGTEVV
ncbi:sensor histidine kinase [Pontiellaceae bacterium B1224]|nr:sensor histidine kinase [Pontiellaceae bacterium B1224]